MSPTNIDQITKDIVLEFSKKATEKELQKIPKVLLYIILDNIIAKACIEPKFCQTYTNLILKLTHSEAFVKIILNSKHDQEIFKNQAANAKFKSNLDTQYCKSTIRKIIQIIIDEQLKTGLPRSQLYQIHQTMTPEQIEYKKNLIDIYMSGLGRLIAMFYESELISSTYIEEYSNVILKSNYLQQFSQTKNSFELLHSDKKPEKELFKTPNIRMFKQQIAFLNEILPYLYWYKDT